MPGAWRDSPDWYGRILIWVDIALRRRGFGLMIDNLIPQIRNQLRNDFDEAAERELQAAGPEIGKTLQLVQTIFTEGAAGTSAR